MRHSFSSHKPCATGFSLVEMAIVLLVLGVLAQATLAPLSALDATRRERAMQSELLRIREALLGHLLSFGELPCPQAADGAVQCPQRGLVPAASLRLDLPRDERGAALDPWGRPYRYAISHVDDARQGTETSPDWTSADTIVERGVRRLRGSLVVCQIATVPCPVRATLADDLVFVVTSLGADDSIEGLQGLNQADRGRVFTRAPVSTVSHTAFDDGLLWLSRSEAVWWLLRAQRLP